MFKTIGWMLLSALCTMLVAAVVNAADEKPAGAVVQKFEVHGDVWIVPELGALITSDDGVVAVKMTPPPGHLPKDYQSVDLKAGDQILMVNAKKVTSPKDLEATYDALAVGDEFKLGIKRDGEMQIVSFKKADPSTLPKRKMVVQGGPGDVNITKGPNMAKIKVDPDTRNVTPLRDAQIFIGEKDKKVLVVGIMPGAEQIYGNGGFKDGDILLSVQGQAVTSAKQIEEAMDAIKINDPVKVVVSRGGKEVTIAFEKSEAVTRTLIQKQ